MRNFGKTFEVTAMNNSLIQKYNVPGPRYTSYPTVPYWDDNGISTKDWRESVIKSFGESNQEEGISLYIHLPFCESLCTFCGCNKRITKNHSVEDPYIEAILKEWDLYTDMLPSKPYIRDLHFGGGTPTFFHPEKLTKLIEGIFKKAERHPKSNYSFEGHPNNTTKEHLIALYEQGFRRASFGVQDYDPLVQKTINRIQPFDKVKEITEQCREVGFTSISHDLVFGLPHQKLESIVDTIEKTRELLPERIAFYSYAHVPWIKGVGQRGFSEKDLPKDEEKRALYEKGLEMFEEIGYKEIGMDHFALPDDDLFKAVQNKTLHRNFMGYTAHTTQLMIGLGVSSIGDSWYGFAQNEKTVEKYYERLEKNEIPIFRGHLLTEEDLILRRQILNIMCHFETTWNDQGKEKEVIDRCLPRLGEVVDDGLAIVNGNSLQITEKGKPFIRNTCMAFDQRLWDNKPTAQLFSMTI